MVIFLAQQIDLTTIDDSVPIGMKVTLPLKSNQNHSHLNPSRDILILGTVFVRGHSENK
jgi:hypothetical protein